ncbi:MAG: hypothetical protein Q9188_001276 [Gyalolechia gomerana]
MYPHLDCCFRNEAYGWHFQYLTVIGLALATIAFLLGSLADVTSSYRLARYKNAVSIVATPLEVIISALYGGLVSVDKELVIPKEFQLGLLPDISLHAVPAILLTIDFLLLSPPWAISFRQSLALSTALAFTYWFWVETCYRHNGWYPYPIFQELTTPWRIALFAFSGVLMAGSAASLKLIYGALNGFDRKRS